MKQIILHADGACSNNGMANACGGFAAILTYGDSEKIVEGAVLSEEHPTNNRMELYAVIEGIKAIKASKDGAVRSVKVYTDSVYVCKNITDGNIRSWRQNNWCLKSGKPVSNKDLWLQLISAAKERNLKLEFNHVYGHASDHMNNRCDQLAHAHARHAYLNRTAGIDM